MVAVAILKIVFRFLFPRCNRNKDSSLRLVADAASVGNGGDTPSLLTDDALPLCLECGTIEDLGVDHAARFLACG